MRNAAPEDREMLTKLERYRKGMYLMKIPPVLTARWTESDWIRYIDHNGTWIYTDEEIVELQFVTDRDLVWD